MSITSVNQFLDASNDWPGWLWAAALCFGICFLWTKLPQKFCPNDACWLASCAAGAITNLYLAAPAPEHAPAGPFRFKLAAMGFLIGLFVRAGYKGILIALSNKFPIVKSILDSGNGADPSGPAAAPQPNSAGATGTDMKKLTAILGLCALGFTAHAQSVTNVPSFAQTALSWVTSLNTNSVIWQNDNVDILVGADNQNSIPVDASLGVQATVYKALCAESWTRNAAIAGTIVSQQAGIGVQFSKYDLKLAGFIDLGYSLQQDTLYVAPAGQLSKGMTQNTFAFIRLEEDFKLKKRQLDTPLIGIGVGATF